MFFNAYKAMSSNSHYSISIILSIHNFFFHSVRDLWLYTWFGVVWIALCVIDVGEFLVASHELLSAALSGQVAFFKHLLELWNSNQCVQELRHRLSPSTTAIQTHTQVPRSFIKIKVQYKCNYTEKKNGFSFKMNLQNIEDFKVYIVCTHHIHANRSSCIMFFCKTHLVLIIKS